MLIRRVGEMIERIMEYIAESQPYREIPFLAAYLIPYYLIHLTVKKIAAKKATVNKEGDGNGH